MFNPESFQISADKTHKDPIDNIKYHYICSLSVYKNSSLFFKSHLMGYCFIFEREFEKNGTQCFRNLSLMQDRNQSKHKMRIGKKTLN